MTTTFGVIGFGRMGYRTVLAGRQAGMSLSAILDSSAAPWGTTQDASLAPYLCTALQDFRSKKPDVVAISTTADSHAALFTALVEAGVKKILVEKPVACSVGDGVDMAALAQANTVQVVVNHNHRGWEPLGRIKSFDGDPRFGRLTSIIITQGAGGLGNLGTHYFDLANYVFGMDPEAVMGTGTQPEADNPRGAQFQDIGGAVIVRYPQQRRMILEIGDDTGVIGGYEFRFERGRVVMPFVSEAPQVYVRKPDAQGMPKHFYGAALEQIPFDDFTPGDVVAGTQKCLMDLLSGHVVHGASLEQATTALEVMVAARLSIERASVESLPLNREDRARRYALA